ncbi:MAG TPA: beta-ketoacyl-ACP synthase III [Bacteroidales bacterium]|nr:beta-ketoacyl-ACP synthase III [Bacteroidales bacterium]
MNTITAAITGVFGWAPEDVITNEELAQMVDTNDEWITSRTGIKERRVLKNPQLSTSDMAVKAIEGLLKQTNTKAEDIEVIIVATITPDMVFPSCAALTATKIGAKNAFAFDLNSACSGFIFGLETAAQFITSGKYKKVILVGADKMTSLSDYTNRNTCILFGDAAAAVLLEPNAEGNGVIDAVLHVDSNNWEHLCLRAGGAMKPATHETVDAHEHFIHQEGQPVFKIAVNGMAGAARDILSRNNITGDDIAFLIPHQANKRIIDSTGHFLGLTPEKICVNIEKYGNTTAATIPLCMYEFSHKFKKGDNLILAAFGAGYSWGAMYLKWAY